MPAPCTSPATVHRRVVVSSPLTSSCSLWRLWQPTLLTCISHFEAQIATKKNQIRGCLDKAACHNIVDYVWSVFLFGEGGQRNSDLSAPFLLILLCLFLSPLFRASASPSLSLSLSFSALQNKQAAGYHVSLQPVPLSPPGLLSSKSVLRLTQ